LSILCILAALAGSIWVLRPFIASTIWATMIVISTWPLLISLQARLGGRRGLAVAIMTLSMIILLIGPLGLAIATIVDNADAIVRFSKDLLASGLPPLPDWLANLPLVGRKLSAFWSDVAGSGANSLLAKVQPYAAKVGQFLLSQMGSIGAMLLQFLLIVIISAILYATGESAAFGVRRFARRLSGERGDQVVILAAQACRGVALGVGLTAIVQTVFGGLGLAIAGVPFAALLSAVMLMCCIVQIGPSIVLFPAVGWLFYEGNSGWGTFLLIWSIAVAVSDNFLRPYLIKKGADLPLLLIFAGVIGGMVGFGLIGLFMGPVILAVSYTVLTAWIEEQLGRQDESA
jgi:predicted PurR-regulated permease PerM